ncbi:MAG: hypothetical protein ACREIA_26290 [Opitutaceae bacterium]
MNPRPKPAPSLVAAVLLLVAAGCLVQATDEDRRLSPQVSARTWPSTPPPGTTTSRSVLPHHGTGAEAPTNPRAATVEGHAAGRIQENLARGLVAVRSDNSSVYLSWRLLEGDSADAAFDVHRVGDGSDVGKINDRPLVRTTDFIDRDLPADIERLGYYVVPVGQGVESRQSKVVEVNLEQRWPGYFAIPLKGNYSANKLALADLTGDGRFEFIIRKPAKGHGPGSPWIPSTDTYKIEAYTQEGERLWQHDMGWSVELGGSYAPYVAYDLDGDGRAEVAVKYNPGDYRDMEEQSRRPDTGEGRVRSGPEFLAVLDGISGEMKARIEWPDREEWTEKLEIPDGDGRDEVLLGSLALDDDGGILWTTGLGHSDGAHVGDLDPAREGLEIYFNIENRPHNLDQLNTMCMVEAKTGRLIWGYDRPTRHVHGIGLCSDIDADYPGAECYGGEKFDPGVRWLWSSKGELLATDDLDNFEPHAVYWDDNPQREIILGVAEKSISEGVNTLKHDYSNHHVRRYRGPVLSPEIEGTVVAVADIFGDWREEIVTAKAGELRIYFSTIPARFRANCLLQDTFYRSNIASISGGGLYIPTLSHDLATLMKSMGKQPDHN